MPTGVRRLPRRAGPLARLAVLTAAALAGISLGGEAKADSDLIFADGFEDCTGDPLVGTPCDGPDTDLCAEGVFECADGVLQCTDATGDSNLVADGGFEAGAMAGVWTEFSTNFGTPICSVAVCGPSGGTNARSGVYWAWFGGIDTAETAFARQSLVIPAGTATLTFWLEVLVCDPVGSDVFTVRIDGQTVFSATNTDPACNQIGYVQKTIDVTAFADGDSHTLEFLGVFNGAGSGFTDFMVDDVRLESCP